MLYTYRPINHSFAKLHAFVSDTVLNVWCKPKGPFRITLLHPDFQTIVRNVSKHKKDYLLRPIRLVYGRMQTLSPAQIKMISTGFKKNNSIENLCSGTGRPLLFSKIQALDTKLAKYLNDFGKDLYSHVTQLKACTSSVGTLDDLYDKLILKSQAELCPFCGLNDIKSPKLTKRDAFDHYFSKDKYPFISVNPLNLAPICSDCNSSYKLQKDPIYEVSGKRRKAFFPYSSRNHRVRIKIELKSSDLSNLAPSDLEVTLSCIHKEEEVDGWSDLFGLKERYADKCCKRKDGQSWYRKVVEDGKNYMSVQKMYEMELRTAKKRRLSDNNFLRVPFLVACNKMGLIK